MTTRYVSDEPIAFLPTEYAIHRPRTTTRTDLAAGSLTSIPAQDDHRATQQIPRESMRSLIYGDEDQTRPRASPSRPKRLDDTAPFVPVDLIEQEKVIAAALAMTVSDGSTSPRRPSLPRETWVRSRTTGRWCVVRGGK